MTDEQTAILQDFLVESTEGLDEFEEVLLRFDSDGSAASVDAAFRCLHSLKGSCGMLGFVHLEKLAHVSENVLSEVRDGKRPPTEALAAALTDVSSAIRGALSAIEANGGTEGIEDFSSVLSQLHALDAAPSVASEETAAEPKAEPATATSIDNHDSPTKEDEIVLVESAERELTQPEPEAPEESKAPRLGELLVERGLVREGDLYAALLAQDAGDPRHVGEILVERGFVTSAQIKETLERQREARAVPPAEGSIRVNVKLLDTMMNLAGELVLARNQILQYTAAYQDRGFHNSCARLNLITTELQERVMQTRMQPIGKVWNKIPRVVVRLAQVCGKEVGVEMDGHDTELDKTILEAIKDPLTHFIRNSVDHGIESPQERKEAGKPRRGKVLLKAVQEGGQVLLEVGDDGRGIDVARVRSKAVERGLLSQVDATRMTDQEALQLIFQAGFSTAETVTNVSGRGVGMDVVKTNIERVGGAVTVESVRGRGTKFSIKIPLTLAIIPALLITSGESRYALPQSTLLELVQFDTPSDQHHIEYVDGNPFYRLRGRLLPLVYLSEALGHRVTDRETTNIVVLRSSGGDFGLVVDSIQDTAEIVVKPLARQLKRISAFSGATILGDGSVALILDVVGLAPPQVDVLRRNEDSARDGAGSTADSAQRLLLFTVGGRRYAASLAAISRLEEVSPGDLEQSHGRMVIQYRDAILPVFRLSEVLGLSAPPEPEQDCPLLVHHREGTGVGLLVDDIIDVVQQSPQVQPVDGDPWVVGSAVIGERVTDVLHIARLVECKGLGWLGTHAGPTSSMEASL